MKKPLRHIIVLSLALLPAGVILAQRHSRKPAGPVKPAAPVLKATVDKQKILIGEPVHLMLEATVEGNGPLVWPALDSLPHFDWVEKQGVDSTVAGTLRSYRQYLTITSFDSGTWSIPRLPFVAGKGTFFTDSIPIQVGYVRIDPSKDYHDIKDIVQVPNPFARWFGWIVAALALVSVLVVVWIVRRKKLLKLLVPWQPPPRLSPYEEALRQLDELAKQNLVADGAVKTFYSRLGDILRLYLFRRVGIASLSETSDELIAQIRKLPLPPQHFEDLATALRMGDFVKFAKYQPEVKDSDLHYGIIRGAIEELNRNLETEERAQAMNAGALTK
ncbi:MAG TPA: hypothetical protein VL978_02650 [Puia sp.]|nr:hypothetical protein [Puia sp.]